MSKPVIKVNDLSKEFKIKINRGFFKNAFFPKYRKVNAVNSISFEIAKGESVAFLGPNGAGKTTTTKMLTGLIYPTSGEISVLDYFPFDRNKEFLKRIGLVMGNKAGLNWDLTPRQSFDLLRQIYNIETSVFEKRIIKLTELLDISKFLDNQVRKLSLGERMKMELIGAILHEPEILFLDEPTIGLDIISKEKVREFLRQIQKDDGITILLTSHDMDDIEKVCDRVIVINNGEKVYDDSIVSLTKNYKTSKFIKFEFLKKPTVEEFKATVTEDFEILESSKRTITLKIDSTKLAKVISSIAEKFQIDDIDIISVPLEKIIGDIFTASAKPR